MPARTEGEVVADGPGAGPGHADRLERLDLRPVVAGVEVGGARACPRRRRRSGCRGGPARLPGPGPELVEQRGEVVGGRDRRGAHDAVGLGRVGEGHPALAVRRRPAAGHRAVAPDPDRGRLLDRHGDELVAGGGEVAALVGDRLARPGQGQDLEGLVEELVALVEVDAEGPELRLQVAGGRAQDHPPARQRVEGGHRLRQQERVAVGDHGDVGEEPQPLGCRRGPGEGDEGVEGVVAAGVQPAVRRHRVLGEGQGVEARRPRPPGPPRPRPSR